MKFLVTHRHAFFLGFFGLFVSLLLHDWNLYPNLRPYGVPVLSALRFFLLSASLVFGWMLVSGRRVTGVKRGLLWLGWAFFLPYTIYSVTEIRHVAELCRLSRGGTYTGLCIDQLWMLYPTLIYALAGTLIFVFTLSQVSTKSIAISGRKRLFILGVCLYASLASVFGLYTRLNVWDALWKPGFTFRAISQTLAIPSFYLNALGYFLFTAILFFVLNRTLYRAYKYIFD
jgi:uncharacterized membrane protein